MSRSIFVIFSVFFLGICAVNAQTGNVKGTILDNKSKENIPFATVRLQNESTKRGASSDFDGNFNFEKVPYGTYQLIVSYIGYENTTIEKVKISKKNQNINLGNVGLGVNTEALKEVTVNAITKTQVSKIDRKTYKTSDFATAKGGNASDVLNKLPSVSVDPDGHVSVRGTQDFIVYLNGKPTNIKPSILLAQISSNTIDKIDVITVPTARYDAQGKGGIINITTKKNSSRGLSVSMNGLLGGAPWADIEDNYSGHKLSDDRYGGGFNLTYNNKSYTLYGGFNYNMKNVNGKRSGQARVLTSKGPDEYFHMNAKDGQRPEWYEYYSANAGIDFNLSDTKKLSVSYFYGNRNDGRAAYYVYNTFFADANGTNKSTDPLKKEQFMYNPNIDNRFGEYSTFNVDYSVALENEASFKVAAAYETSKLSRELSNKNYFYDTREDVELGATNGYLGNTPDEYSLSDATPLKGVRLSMDYAKDYDNGSSFGAGAQIQYTNIDGDFNFVDNSIAKDLNNSIDLTRNIYAAYIDYSATRGKLSYIFGLRTEYGDQSMDVANTDYLSVFGKIGQSNYSQDKLDLFPSAHFSYKISDNNKLTLAGSRRINRASVTKIAPFLYRRHFEVYVVGDPELEAEYLNNAEISYETNLGKNTVSLTGFYRGTDNTVFRVNTVTTAIENPDIHAVLGEDVLIRSYTNAGNSTSLGAELNANIITGSFAKFFIGGSLYNYKIKGDVFGYAVDQNSTNWSLKGNVNFTLSDEVKLNFDHNVRSATVTSQGSNDAFSVSNIALNYQPKNAKGWDFSARGLDVFSVNNTGLDTNALNASGDQIFYQETQYVRNGPVFEIGVSYVFNAKSKKKKAKGTQADKHFK